MMVITVNQPKTTNEATPQNAAKKFFFLSAESPPKAARMVTRAKIITKPMETPPFIMISRHTSNKFKKIMYLYYLHSFLILYFFLSFVESKKELG